MDIFFKEYDYEASKQWLVNHEGFLLKSVMAYVIMIWSIRLTMRNFKPFDLQSPLIIWNAILAIFSVLGFIFVTPTFLKVINEKGIQYTYTHISDIHKSSLCGYWTFLWIVSKMPEFLDTIFIVLRKKPLMFMHWYHHALTGWFAFVTFYEENAYMVWVVWLNYFIHSFMYSYYCARALHIKVPPQFAQIITGAQIVQFLITHAVMAHAFYLASTGATVALTTRGFTVGAIMEVTYLLLWFRFYYVSYISGGGKKYLAAKKQPTKAE